MGYGFPSFFQTTKKILPHGDYPPYGMSFGVSNPVMLLCHANQIPEGTKRTKRQMVPSSRPSRSPLSASPPRYRERRRRRHTPSSPEEEGEEKEPTPPPKRKRPEPNPITMRTGGAYIPPARLRMMQEGITDKNSVAYQRIAWEALKKSINGLVNKVCYCSATTTADCSAPCKEFVYTTTLPLFTLFKRSLQSAINRARVVLEVYRHYIMAPFLQVNVSNIANILQEMFQENVVRGRGLLARSVIQAQAASPMFSHVYAALVAIVNTKFPQTGELIAKRIIVRFRRAFRRNDKVSVQLEKPSIVGAPELGLEG